MAIITVNTGVDDTAANAFTSLREALAIAQGTAEADTIVFATGVNEIDIDPAGGPLVIVTGQRVTIDGDRNNDGASDVAIDGNSSTHHFTIEAGANATLVGLTLENGRGYGSAGGSGGDGARGYNGRNGASSPFPGGYGSFGGNAGVGENGYDGANGEDTASSILNFGQLTLAQTTLVDNRAVADSGGAGGDGGDGGTGGAGGNGGNGAGGDGAFGGFGGSAGDGGDGGDGGAAATIVNGVGGRITLIDTTIQDNAAYAGLGGYGGDAGVGGNGGNGGNGGQGGQGGQGGDGGPGGDGGNGGSSGNGGAGAGAILNRGVILSSTAAAIVDNFGVGGNVRIFGPGYGADGGGGGIGGTSPVPGYQGTNGRPGDLGFFGSSGSRGASSNGAINGGSGTGAVTAVDGLIYVSATDLEIAEGDAGGTTFTFHINRSGASTQGAQVQWQLIPGDGVTAADFVNSVIPSGTVSFTANGVNQVAVTFQVRGDVAFEDNEAFTINLSNLLDPSGGMVYGLGITTVNGVIRSDEPLSIVYADASRTTVVSEQATALDATMALRTLTGNRAFQVIEPSVLGNIGALTINAENVTIFADAPFDASLTLGGVVERITLSGTATIDVTGNAQNNVITGNAGANRLNGGAGIDTLIGGAGNDIHIVDNAGDRPIEAAGGGADTVQSSVSYGLFAGQAIETLTTTNDAGVAAINLSGNEFNNAIRGNAGNNGLSGRGGADTMTGLAGNDVYVVDNAGDRAIEAVGGGVDTVQSSVSYGLVAGQEIEILTTDNDAGTGAINLSGNEFAQTIRGNAGNNGLTGRLGADTMIGFGGNDIYVVDNAGDRVVEAVGGGTDTVQSSVSYALQVGQAIETLTTDNNAGLAAVNLSGNEFAQTIRGNAGNNGLTGRGGADTMIGLAGNDIYVVDNAGDRVVEAVGGGADTVQTSVSYALQVGQAIETLTTDNNAGLAAINLTGNEFAQTIRGNAGNNGLSGRAGADTMTGFAGNDIYVVDNAGDRVVEAVGGGTDTVQSSVSYGLQVGQEIEILTIDNNAGVAAINLSGNEFAQTIRGNAGNNGLSGGASADTMTGFAGNDIYVVDNVGDQAIEAVGGGADTVQTSVSYALQVGQAIETLTTDNNAGLAAINLSGNEFAQTIRGNAGNNGLTGRGGADTMIGFGGNDVYVIDNAGDRVVEAVGGGTDTVQSSVSYGLQVGQAIETLTTDNNAGLAAINLSGNEFAQTIRGNAGNNGITGRGGADTMIGFGGNDIYVVDNAGDQVTEAVGGGADTVQASVTYALQVGQEIETLNTDNVAGVAAINLTGNEFSQTIRGNAGNNVINGRAGADTLLGFGGNDTFAFNTSLGASNIDNIADFVAADDTIQLDDDVFTALATGTLAAAAFKDLSLGAQDASDRILYNKTSGALFYDGDGLGGTGPIQFATLDTKPNMTSIDFIVVA